MSTDPSPSPPPIPTPDLTATVPGGLGPGIGDDWIGDLLLACDAAQAAGLSPPQLAPSSDEPESLAGNETDGRLALAQACLERLHRRWPWPGGETTSDVSQPDQPLAKLGVNLGRYKLLSLIGSGGHGLVFLANDPTLNRNVALKVPRPEYVASERCRKRFLREARALARLDHPGIVPIHDFGESGSVCYLATAYVDGSNLSEWLACQDSLPAPSIAAWLVLAISEAVAHAHSRGVLHRDLKPGNILMEWSRDPGVAQGPVPIPRITDFGLARLLDDVRDGNQTETRVYGTPRYMAPEQAMGNQAESGPRADVYGLGAILHAILTGEPPECPVDPSRTDLAHPGPLGAIVSRCLQAEPGDRYPTPAALADDLRRYLDGQPLIATRLGRGPLRKVWSRLKVGRLGVASLAAAMGIIVSFAVAQWVDRGSREPLDLVIPDAYPKSEDPKLQYIKDVRRAFRVIREQHNSALADSQHLDRWNAARPEAVPDPRGFEWGYLKNLGHRESLTLRHGTLPDGKPSEIYQVRYSADARRLVSAGQDGTARIWDARSGELFTLLKHNPISISWATFSPDGSLVATACDDGAVRVWEVGSGTMVRELRDAHGGKTAVCVLFTPDGKLLVSGGRDHTLAIWDVGTGREVHRVNAQINEIESLAISRDGQFAVACGLGNNRISILNLQTLNLRLLPHSGSHASRSVDITPDGRSIVLAVDHDVLLVDPAGLSPDRRLRSHRNEVYAVAFTADGGSILSAGAHEDTAIRVWNPVSSQIEDILPGHRARIWGIVGEPNGSHIASASDDGTVKIWDLARRTDRAIVPVPKGTEPIAFGISTGVGSLGGKSGISLQVISRNGQLISMDSSGRKEVARRQLFDQPLSGAIFAPDGLTVAGLIEARAVEVADLAGSQPPVHIAVPLVNNDPRSIALDNNGRFLSCVTAGSSPISFAICLMQTATGRLVKRLAHPGLTFNPIGGVFSPDGERLTAHDPYGGGIALWDIPRETMTLNSDSPPPGFLHAIAVSPDGKYLATGDHTNTVQIRDARTLAMRSTLIGHIGHADDVTRLAFTPDSNRLASADASGGVILWDVATGEDLIDLEGVNSGLEFLQFTPDGQTLIGAGTTDGGWFILWHADRPRAS